DIKQLKAAIEELIANALEACPPSGEISVMTLMGSKDVSVCIQNDLTPEARISTAVAAPDPIRPFISWKSGHAGMGLTIAERIIAEHEGELTIETNPDRVFKATMSFPIRTKTV
ncbi:MAG: ATP-binding protein, partial [Candidatus Zixiibacteriota bacterium]